MIETFRDRDAERRWHGRPSRRLPADIRKAAIRKLRLLDAALRLDDLKVPPGNHLEALGADRRGQHGIRINDQWRLCFRWSGTSARDVEIVDYHRG